MATSKVGGKDSSTATPLHDSPVFFSTFLYFLRVLHVLRGECYFEAKGENNVLATAGRAAHTRFYILGLLTIGTMINYLDRTVLGIAAPALTADLGIGAATMGIVFSAFSWTYAAMQIPGGIFLDRFGSRLTYFLSLNFWSLSTLLHGLATGLATLLSCRFALGVSEAP